MKKKLSNSIRKFIRNEKSRLRREISDAAELQQKIDDLYKRFLQVDPMK